MHWQPAGTVEDAELAHGMVRVLAGRSPSVEAHVVPLDRLASEVGGEEAERILDRVHNPTTAETARSQELEREAAALLGGTRERRALEVPRRPVERRSGVERRGGHERRRTDAVHAAERRTCVDRRTGVDRRGRAPLAV